MYYTTDRPFAIAVFIVIAIVIKLLPYILPVDDPKE